MSRREAAAGLVFAVLSLAGGAVIALAAPHSDAAAVVSVVLLTLGIAVGAVSVASLD